MSASDMREMPIPDIASLIRATQTINQDGETPKDA